jgi:hypothetical protein
MPDAGPSASEASILAQRIRFVHQASPGQRVLAEFTDPYQRFAVAEPVSVEALPPPGQDAVPPDEFYFLFIPAGSATPYDWQQRAAQWMAKPSSATAEPTLEVVMRSDRVLWRPGRGMVQGAPDRVEENLLALVDFAFYEGELRKLEREIEADWSLAQADIELTHQVATRQLRRSAHVNEMTQRTTRRRMRVARLERHLEKASIALPGSARRLVSELLTQAEIVDRLKAVDNRLEVYEDLYELANDRLSEYRYYRGEFRLEVWIILILMIEVVLMLWEIYLTYTAD